MLTDEVSIISSVLRLWCTKFRGFSKRPDQAWVKPWTTRFLEQKSPSGRFRSNMRQVIFRRIHLQIALHHLFHSKACKARLLRQCALLRIPSYRTFDYRFAQSHVWKKSTTIWPNLLRSITKSRLVLSLCAQMRKLLILKWIKGTLSRSLSNFGQKPRVIYWLSHYIDYCFCFEISTQQATLSLWNYGTAWPKTRM